MPINSTIIVSMAHGVIGSTEVSEAFSPGSSPGGPVKI